MRRAASLLTGMFLAATLPLLGCSEGGEHHGVNVGGVKHADGYQDPLARCVQCHGPALRGGSGPSCYGCHTNANHTVARGGISHREGATTICPSCHGPGGSGGLGPSCYTCHASYPG